MSRNASRKIGRRSFVQQSRPGRGHRSYRPLVEHLEGRHLLATITVNTALDDLTPNDGSVSLREAITAMNAGNDLGDPNITAQSPGTFGTNDTINFIHPLNDINLGSGLPTIAV